VGDVALLLSLSCCWLWISDVTVVVSSLVTPLSLVGWAALLSRHCPDPHGRWRWREPDPLPLWCCLWTEVGKRLPAAPSLLPFCCQGLCLTGTYHSAHPALLHRH